jgi:ribosomal protein S18 acetylase RimI-like enzyme
LLTSLEEHLDDDRPLKLEVRKSNIAAIQFYERRGFRETGLLVGYYSDGEDGVSMEKTSDKTSRRAEGLAVAA